MGLRVYIYRTTAFEDCSNGGVSSRCGELTITNVSGPFDPTPSAPAAVLCKREHVGNIVVVPQELLDRKAWSMFGGCLVHSSDSRWTDALRSLSGYKYLSAISLHDRTEA